MKSSGEAKPRIPACVYIFTFFAAIGGFEMGYNFSVVSGAMILVIEEFHLSTFWQVLIESVWVFLISSRTAASTVIKGFFEHRRLKLTFREKENDFFMNYNPL